MRLRIYHFPAKQWTISSKQSETGHLQELSKF
jgi:hypothetical protein